MREVAIYSACSSLINSVTNTSWVKNIVKYDLETAEIDKMNDIERTTISFKDGTEIASRINR